MNRRYDLGYVVFHYFITAAMHTLVNGCWYNRTAGQEVRKACEFLVSHQMEDGGWGEEFAVSYNNIVFLYYTIIQWKSGLTEPF